ncbi:hypothetical protein EYF80_014025 [Liparis tanakae]|uniref:Uncharacterized protein n=1 Tax=Liparis tanakae TaxID=230148 RepID=A0A4Z2IEA2_9TELE|nr:hypothetical protein EYF80_014025 [Liparis tanakae]
MSAGKTEDTCRIYIDQLFNPLRFYIKYFCKASGNHERTVSFALNGAECPGLGAGVAAAGTGLLERGGFGGRRKGSVRSPVLRARLGTRFRTCVWRRDVWVTHSDVDTLNKKKVNIASFFEKLLKLRAQTEPVGVSPVTKRTAQELQSTRPGAPVAPGSPLHQ